jgi:hypothetical protein
MIDFLQNPWVVGVAGGIISGIIVFYITQWIFRRKDNSKYIEQISLANSEIIRILKPYVAEKGLPELNIISALIAATARKYRIEVKQIYSIRIICEELIKEVIENVYVSSEKKEEYSQGLNDYLLKMERTLNEEQLLKDQQWQKELIDLKSNQEFKNKYMKYMSSVLALFASIISITLVVFSNMNDFMFIDKFDLFPIDLIPAIYTITTAFIATLFVFFIKRK